MSLRYDPGVSPLPNVCVPFAYKADQDYVSQPLKSSSAVEKAKRGYAKIDIGDMFPKPTPEYDPVPVPWLHPLKREQMK